MELKEIISWFGDGSNIAILFGLGYLFFKNRKQFCKYIADLVVSEMQKDNESIKEELETVKTLARHKRR